MKQNYKDDTFLARWLNNELTLKEVNDFEKSSEFKDYQKIRNASEMFYMPQYNKAEAFKKITEKTINYKTKKVIPSWVYTMAASIVILIGSYYIYSFSNNTVSTDFGEQVAIILPDSSEVYLNAKSTLNYNKKNWNKNRTIKLQGEAFFKVKKGSAFVVNTSKGKVKVLGTQFNVISNNDYFETQCYEGKVSVEIDTEKIVLTKGKACRNVENKTEQYSFKEDSAPWVLGESVFQNTPLLQVVKSLEKQFKIKIKYKKIDVKKRFSGTFNHKNLQLALKTVFAPMEISYTFKEKNTIILFKD